MKAHFFFLFLLLAFTSVISKITFKLLLPQIFFVSCLYERRSLNTIRDVSCGPKPCEDEVQPSILKMAIENYYYFTLRHTSMLSNVYMYCIITQYSVNQKFLFSV